MEIYWHLQVQWFAAGCMQPRGPLSGLTQGRSEMPKQQSSTFQRRCISLMLTLWFSVL